MAKPRARGWKKRSGQTLDDLAVKSLTLAVKGKSLGEIVGELGDDGVLNERDASRLIARAREEDLVEIEVKRKENVLVSPEIDRDLGRRVSELSGITDVVVVKTTLAHRHDFKYANPAEKQEKYKESDELNQMLGYAAADQIWPNLRDNDVIGLSGGRATGATVERLEVLARERPRSLSGVEILALTGSMISRNWADGNQGANFDADELALRLGSALNITRDAVHLVNLPVALAINQHSRIRSLNDVIQAVCPHIKSGPWPRIPTIGIWGLGVLNTGHHALQYEGPQTANITLEIAELKTSLLCKGHHTLIADMGNQYFRIADENVSSAVAKKTQDIIDRLNAKTVGVGFEKLDQIGVKVLVVGGGQKYPGVRALLKMKAELKISVTKLVTDEYTANKLLRDL